MGNGWLMRVHGGTVIVYVCTSYTVTRYRSHYIIIHHSTVFYVGIYPNISPNRLIKNNKINVQISREPIQTPKFFFATPYYRVLQEVHQPTTDRYTTTIYTTYVMHPPLWDLQLSRSGTHLIFSILDVISKTLAV